ncbi:hypothetical protein VCRA2122O339_150024 [Vibrio crassostreae]|nr:hypothetical protein VCRA2120E331_80023 [Vibrio crassostreae]CAK3252172.1 hypothetical protein VCRA2122O339_150024 [Vibrio crassostreae]CAK3621734.1 hypothetical protein VCRA2127O345_80023 [Vibrio crassostreae]CAK3645250.1 hypothetical protein VCRA2120E330_90023 [Vibrio crassostreae]CAK3670210.1 hypothetical protein VCRA2122O338_80137 [Vibrio crassostreae]
MITDFLKNQLVNAMLNVVLWLIFTHKLVMFWACVLLKNKENGMQNEIPNLKGCVSSLLRGEYYETVFNSIDVNFWWCSGS